MKKLPKQHKTNETLVPSAARYFRAPGKEIGILRFFFNDFITSD